MSQKLATAAETDDLTPRATPIIPKGNIKMNARGFIWSEYIVRLPAGFIADDLKEPTIWSAIQTGENSLRRHDRLYIVAFDESWVAESIVADATRDTVVLAKPKITQIGARFDTLMQTEDYRICWDGFGYFVERKADSQRMTRSVGSAALAERDLQALYPRKAG